MTHAEPDCVVRHRHRRYGAQRAAASGHHGGAGRQDRRGQRRGRGLLRSLDAAAAPPRVARSRAVRLAAARADRAGAQPRLGGERISRRSLDAAQSGRAAGRSQRRARAGAAGPCGGDAAGAHHRRQDGPPAHPSRRRALGDRARLDAGARDQEPALRHPRRRATARASRQRRRPHAHAPDLRRGRPHREAGRPHGGVRRRAAGGARAGQHPCGARPGEEARAVGLWAPHQVRRDLRSVAARRCSRTATSSSRCFSIS